MISRGLEADAGALGDLPGPRFDHIITVVLLSCVFFCWEAQSDADTYMMVIGDEKHTFRR